MGGLGRTGGEAEKAVWTMKLNKEVCMTCLRNWQRPGGIVREGSSAGLGFIDEDCNRVTAEQLMSHWDGENCPAFRFVWSVISEDTRESFDGACRVKLFEGMPEGFCRYEAEQVVNSTPHEDE